MISRGKTYADPLLFQVQHNRLKLILFEAGNSMCHAGNNLLPGDHAEFRILRQRGLACAQAGITDLGLLVG